MGTRSSTKMKTRIHFLAILILAMGVISSGIIGCGSDSEEPPDVVANPSTSEPSDDGEVATSRIDLAAEKAEVLNLWATFMQAYNDRDMTDIGKMWTNKTSDYLYVNIADNEAIDASGGSKVRDTLVFLTKGHNSTASDLWTGSNMNQVWMRQKNGQLQASAHGPNALRVGETWAYFVKEREWKINKVESIETGNLGKHLKILIHENQVGTGRGFFDDDKYLVQ
jgi:hypothetical protein